MINAMKNEILQIIQFLGGNPSSNVELIIILLLAITGALLVLQKLIQMMKFPLGGSGRSAIVFFFTLFVSIFAVAVVNIYAVPCLPAGIFKQAAGPAAGILVFLAVAAPVACFIFKAKYFRVVLATLLSVAAALAIGLLVRGAITAIKYGGKDFGKTRERKDNINKIL